MSEVDKVVEFLELATPRQLQNVLAAAGTSRKSEPSDPAYPDEATAARYGTVVELSRGQRRRSPLASVRRRWSRMLSRSSG